MGSGRRLINPNELVLRVPAPYLGQAAAARRDPEPPRLTQNWQQDWQQGSLPKAAKWHIRRSTGGR